MAGSAIGSATPFTTRSRASCSVSSSVRTGTCFVWMRWASTAASPLSSYDSSANCAENVCTRSTPMNFAASVARMDESRPPLMKTPTGTSLIICFSTARSISRCNSATAPPGARASMAGEAEHDVELPTGVDAACQVGRQDGLAVAPGAVRVLGKLGADVEGVVDLAIALEPALLAGRGEGLVGALVEVDDAQPLRADDGVG